MVNRREFLKLGVGAAAGLFLSSRWAPPTLAATLLDPLTQPKFAYPVPNALSPGFIYGGKKKKDKGLEIGMYQFPQNLGIVDPVSGLPLTTTVWGYGEKGNKATFPGRTFEVRRDAPLDVQWRNNLVDLMGNPLQHLLPVDTSLHWAYALHNYTDYSIATHGVPLVPHLHGGHTESDSDGNPEYFWSPGEVVKGPRFVKSLYHYDNDQEAGTLWYHDHALGITRLNTYAGLAGFYIIRDDMDTGLPNNPLGLPAYPYEAAFAIQDRMFDTLGRLFFPAFPGDPAWADFITGEGLADEDVPQPSALAEFFGDHILVNGVIWPKMDVEQRHYRLRLLNGSDSRFYVLKLTVDGSETPVPFYQIGTDDGFLNQPVQVDQLVLAPGERADLVVDFTPYAMGTRLVMKNVGPDAPFGGLPVDSAEVADPATTGLIMAFDVTLPFDVETPDPFDPAVTLRTDGGYTVPGTVATTRQLALFEGTDNFGRLQPLLGAIVNSELRSQAWFEPTTETPGLNDVEIWEIYNATMDAHPIHLHLVSFEVLDRQAFSYTLTEVDQTQHDGTTGTGGKLDIQSLGAWRSPEANELGPKDTVHVFPGEVTRVKAKFDRPGRYVWHCHILSHEDHEMMRPLEVGS
jgi:FtsP/CotA-like multicopper oxidase with cupredoxin domain